jgi:hypothetical protein
MKLSRARVILVIELIVCGLWKDSDVVLIARGGTTVAEGGSGFFSRISQY